MPTAAKLAAAVFFGALAWYVSELVKPLFPEGTDLGRFSEYNGLIGMVIGWIVAGNRARTTWANAVAYGLTTALSVLFTGLLIHSSLRMIRQAFRMVYQGPLEAIVDTMRIVTENLQFIATPQVMLTLLLGGIIAGLATEWVARNYK